MPTICVRCDHVIEDGEGNESLGVYLAHRLDRCFALVKSDRTELGWKPPEVAQPLPPEKPEGAPPDWQPIEPPAKPDAANLAAYVVPEEPPLKEPRLSEMSETAAAAHTKEKEKQMAEQAKSGQDKAKVEEEVEIDPETGATVIASGKKKKSSDI